MRVWVMPLTWAAYPALGFPEKMPSDFTETRARIPRENALGFPNSAFCLVLASHNPFETPWETASPPASCSTWANTRHGQVTAF